MANNVIGIDKLVLTSKEFIVPDIPKMKLQPNKELGVAPVEGVDEPIVQTGSGHKIYGSKLYKDSRLLKTCTNVAINKYGLQVTFNPNSHYHPYHSYSDVRKLEDSLHLIEMELKEMGIIAPVTRMRVSRIDANKDQEMEREYSAYKPIYNSMGASRMKATSYTTGVLIKNKSSQQVFYDKGQDQLNKTGEVIPETNLIRSEIRLTKTISVKSQTGGYLSSVENILKYYDHVSTVYYSQAKKVLDNLYQQKDYDQLELQFNEDKDALGIMLNTGKRGVLKEYLAIKGGIDYLIYKYNTIELFEAKVINELEIHPTARKRLKNTLRDLVSQNRFMVQQIDKSRKDMDLLKQEIIDKFSKSA